MSFTGTINQYLPYITHSIIVIIYVRIFNESTNYTSHYITNYTLIFGIESNKTSQIRYYEGIQQLF
jgi:hypothetical protein